MSVRLSEKHGLNPSMIECFFCHESKGIALVGKLPNDREAPRQMLMDYEPCDKCKAMFKVGVLIISVADRPKYPNQLGLRANTTEVAYPDGRWVVVSVEACEKIFNTDPKPVAGQHVMMEDKAFTRIFVDSGALARAETEAHEEKLAKQQS